ncbi:MAG: glycosyltransferase [Chloroflexi bacterium]|nr:glycosyltransferase [Chloroflexota bacterium]
MRILLLTQVVPYPPDSGPKIKTYNVLRYLAERHTLHLVSFTRSSAEVQAATTLRRWCETVDTVSLTRSRIADIGYLARALASQRSFLVERDDSQQMRTTIGQLLARYQFDAVHADQLTMGQFAVDLPIPLRVLDEHNAVWTIVRRAAQHERWGLRRLLAEVEWRRLRGYEGTLCRAFDRVLVVSDEDRCALEAATAGPLAAMVVPIAVDVTELPFAARTCEARTILSMATMFYPPNVEGVEWFARAVLPRIRQVQEDAHFFAVGSRPPPHIQRLGTTVPGMTVTGYVSDLEPYLRRSGVLVVPLHSGSGMRVKILEAFARGIPVVSTTIGVEGISARSGEHLLVADSPGDFAEAVLRILSDRALAARLTAQARALVEHDYDRRVALCSLDDVYSPLPQLLTTEPAALVG